ncbi:hypothetical protein [Deinococcus seoulensis]|nr:hypothetical protein [Deinococcus seoulensis]
MASDPAAAAEHPTPVHTALARDGQRGQARSAPLEWTCTVVV